jgi:hypothetical protein
MKLCTPVSEVYRLTSKASCGMIVNYTEQAKRWGEGRALLEQATRQLGEIVVGASADSVTAEWDAATNGQLIYTLKLRDSFGEVEASFTPEHLQIAPYMTVRLYRLWGDLLKIQSDEQHKKVLQLVREM